MGSKEKAPDRRRREGFPNIWKERLNLQLKRLLRFIRKQRASFQSVGLIRDILPMKAIIQGLIKEAEAEFERIRGLMSHELYIGNPKQNSADALKSGHRSPGNQEFKQLPLAGERKNHPLD